MTSRSHLHTWNRLRREPLVFRPVCSYSTRISEFPVKLLEAQITGVREAIANLTDLGDAEPVVKASVHLSESGFVSVPEVVAHVELKDDTIAGSYEPCSPSYHLNHFIHR